MIKHGYPGCNSCHVDPSGGELLTAYGRMISSEVLSTDWGSAKTGDGETPRFAEPFFGLFGSPESFTPGGSVRLAALATPGSNTAKFRAFPMQVDLAGELKFPGSFRAAGTLGVAQVPEGSPFAHAAQVTRNPGNQLNLISRTHWLAYDFGDGAHTIRVGRLNLPFGVRMSEHVMWVRQQTQTDRESDQQHGAALAMSFETFRFEAMAILGNYQIRPDKFRERGYSAFAELLLAEKTALGVSSLFTLAGDDRLEPGAGHTARQAHGLTLRQGLGERVALLAEADVLLRSKRKAGYTGLAQLDYEPIRSLHAIGTWEVLDAGAATEGNEAPSIGRGRPKLGEWLTMQWFFASHFDLRFDTIFRQAEPTQLLAQLHWYL